MRSCFDLFEMFFEVNKPSNKQIKAASESPANRQPQGQWKKYN